MTKIGDPTFDGMSDEDRNALFDQAYSLLLGQIISLCSDAHPMVAIAACVSAGATICVDNLSEGDGQSYFTASTQEALSKFSEAYKLKARFNGDDTGSQGQGTH